MAAGKGNRSSVNRRSVLKGAAGLGAAAALGGRGPRSAGAQEFSGKLTAWGVVSFTEAGDDLLGQQMVEWGEANGVEVEYVATARLRLHDQGRDRGRGRLGSRCRDDARRPDPLLRRPGSPGRPDRCLRRPEGAGRRDVGEPFCPTSRRMASVYSIPMEPDVSVMYARLDLIEQATGTREAPTTLDELEAIATKSPSPPRQFGIGLTCGRTPDANGQMSPVDPAPTAARSSTRPAHPTSTPKGRSPP